MIEDQIVFFELRCRGFYSTSISVNHTGRLSHLLSTHSVESTTQVIPYWLNWRYVTISDAGELITSAVDVRFHAAHHKRCRRTLPRCILQVL